MAKIQLSEKNRYQKNFTVFVDGKHKKVSASELLKNAEYYIKRGYGHYFDIPQEEAIAMAAEYTNSLKNAAKAAEQKAQEAIQKELDEKMQLAKHIEELQLQAKEAEAKAKEAEAKLAESAQLLDMEKKRTEEAEAKAKEAEAKLAENAAGDKESGAKKGK